jgi:hypothetical protein
MMRESLQISRSSLAREMEFIYGAESTSTSVMQIDDTSPRRIFHYDRKALTGLTETASGDGSGLNHARRVSFHHGLLSMPFIASNRLCF